MTMTYFFPAKDIGEAFDLLKYPSVSLPKL